ncbi:MAG: aminopeptidase P family protein [Bacteroidetes bacterium]|nr:aminopeptidase P family protein [Bacteroidota bacterium]
MKEILHSEYPTLQDWIQETLTSAKASAMLITHLPHIRWMCGFTGSNGFLIVREDLMHLVTDHRYKIQATLEVSEATIHIGAHNLINYAKTHGLVIATDTLLIQPEYMTLASYQQWHDEVSDISLVPQEKFFHRLVATKSPHAIAGMRRAQWISDLVFDEIHPYIKPGVTEKELAARIDYYHRKHGASQMAFETIVAFGKNTALPHARPTQRELKQDECVLLDFGGIVDGNASDMTRTLFVGSPSEEFLTAYASVRKAQNEAVKTVGEGVCCSDVDRAARSSLTQDGFGEFFCHSTGHGIGMEVHEWPSLSTGSDTILKKGFTVTIEPGVYVPHQFGIRIEDTVAVQSHGCQRLSQIQQDLIIL